MTMLVLKRLTALGVVIAAILASGGLAVAASGQPVPWQLGLQDSATSVMDNIAWFHDFLLWVITVITLFVLALLVWVAVKFNAKANTLIEVLWTVVPVMILVAIAIPSFRLLFYQQTLPPADITVKATGKQWYWSYNYPDHGNFEFDSLLVQEKDLKPGQPRLLAVDNELVVPVNKVVRVLTTGSDVIHAFAVPSFGIKIDSIPGRINETWFRAVREGVYYGQCSEICGTNHAYMPITIEAVSKERFAQWLVEAKEQFASNSDRKAPAVQVAQSVGDQVPAAAAPSAK
jgi:cytochrome c oxidase subunit 2